MVSSVPVQGQLFGGQGEYLGGEIFRGNPGQYEKPCVIDDEVEMLGTLLGGPADEAVAWCDFPCCGTKPEGGQELTVSAKDKVSDLSARKRVASQVMMPFDQFVP